ncbi:homocysteine-induced endoplasmic reticulum protein [Leptinotarsa decemlineata]|uniref:homocysteine-induced endoplasmic reticulum protein n=1 Tax=Leptinotarsa decemlineata TaxID=7539 RepID=UPI000C252A6E|nr:homocysteine-responsive endoplasmic reticulum-resident ubiquitin-like domain member 2 protein [Leptinotarsa decemlineata]
MDSLVTLIVKAPNQQIEDQTIKCEPSWTIQKLKQHLSEVYPSRPPKHEQKLIYSGQLLSDSVTLKDVLRQFEGQETHTVHLVCSSKYTKDIQDQPPVSQASTPNNTNQQTNTPSQSQETTPTVTADQNIPNVPPNMAWFNMNNPPMTPMDPNQYALQLAWMQQAYFQYMTQYMQLAANSFAANPQQIPINGDIPGQIPPNQAEQPPAVPEAPPAAVRDPENAERDWLDIFYLLSRLMVLFSVVYFYSSPLRFLFVLILGISLYLYQIGFFRNINNNNNNNNNGPPEQVQEEEQAPSRFTLVWTFFSTFFASLIPEIPNAL